MQPTRVIQGGMARVYVCPIDPELFGWDVRTVAVKRPREWWEGQAGALFALREVYLWQALGRHPNVNRLYDVSYRDDLDRLTLVMEYHPESVASRLQRHGRAQRPEAVINLLHSVAQALHHAQSVFPDFCHSDIKPANILISSNGDYLLSDFGLSSARTRAGTVTTALSAGTPQYMSYDVIVGAPADWSSDVYALGVTALEVLLGELPPDCARWCATRVAENVSFREILPSIPVTLCLLLDEMLALPSRRPAIGKLLSMIHDIARDWNIELQVPEVPEQTFHDTLGSAQSLLTIDMFDEAFSLAQASFLSASDHDERMMVHLVLAEIHARAGRLVESQRTLAQAAAGGDVSHPMLAAEYHRLLAEIKLRGPGDEQPDVSAAIQSYQRSLTLLPDHEHSMWGLARGLALDGQLTAAIGILEQLIERSALLDYANLLVLLCLQTRRGEDARQHAETAVGRNPTSGWARALRLMASTADRDMRGHDAIDLEEDVRLALVDPGTPDHVARMVRTLTRRA